MYQDQVCFTPDRRTNGRVWVYLVATDLIRFCLEMGHPKQHVKHTRPWPSIAPIAIVKMSHVRKISKDKSALSIIIYIYIY